MESWELEEDIYYDYQIGFLDRHVRLILCIEYSISLLLMFIDLFIDMSEITFFYVVTNSVLLFRLCGARFVTHVLHVGSTAVLFGGFAYVLAYKKYHFTNTLICVICLGLQFLGSLHLVLFRRGRTPDEQALRVDLHALFGLCLICTFFWIIGFLANPNALNAVIQIFYLLAFLMMILTPHFQTDTQTVVLAQAEIQKRILAKRKEVRNRRRGLAPHDSKKDRNDDDPDSHDDRRRDRHLRYDPDDEHDRKERRKQRDRNHESDYDHDRDRDRDRDRDHDRDRDLVHRSAKSYA